MRPLVDGTRVSNGWLRPVVIVIPLVVAACAASPAPTASTTATQPRPTTSGATAPETTAPEAPASEHPLAAQEAWIAYQSNKGGGEGVWLTHPDGSDDHEIAAGVPGEHVHPDWSPDGHRLVVTSRTDVDVLYEVDAETDEARELWPCEGGCVGDDEAVWSPDGSRIAFVRAMEPFVDDVPSCALMVGHLENGEVEQLGPTRTCLERETFPHWSRDGNRLAYYRGVYRGDTVESTALYVYDVGSGRETKLTHDPLFAGDSDWSSGDHWILFSTYPLNDFQCCQVSNLYRIFPDGSGLEQLTREDSPAVRLTQPRYTPDGEALVVTGVTAAARELWILPFDGAGEPIVVSRGGISTHGTWQPIPEH